MPAWWFVWQGKVLEDFQAPQSLSSCQLSLSHTTFLNSRCGLAFRTRFVFIVLSLSPFRVALTCLFSFVVHSILHVLMFGIQVLVLYLALPSHASFVFHAVDFRCLPSCSCGTLFHQLARVKNNGL